jgi:hypothetical protein
MLPYCTLGRVRQPGGTFKTPRPRPDHVEDNTKSWIDERRTLHYIDDDVSIVFSDTKLQRMPPAILTSIQGYRKCNAEQHRLHEELMEYHIANTMPELATDSDEDNDYLDFFKMTPMDLQSNQCSTTHYCSELELLSPDFQSRLRGPANSRLDDNGANLNAWQQNHLYKSMQSGHESDDKRSRPFGSIIAAMGEDHIVSTMPIFEAEHGANCQDAIKLWNWPGKLFKQASTAQEQAFFVRSFFAFD